MLSRETKKVQVKQLADNLSKSKASFLVNCIGLDVEQMTALRKSLKKNKGNIQVIRNTLSLRAMEENEILKKTYSPFMKGPNAFVLAFDDVAKVAKIIDELAEDSEAFQIKGAVLKDKALSLAEVKTLAQLPSHEVLKAQFLGLLSAPLTKFLSTMSEVPAGFARLLSAKSKKNSNKPIAL